jgi:hypothetical protein
MTAAKDSNRLQIQVQLQTTGGEAPSPWSLPASDSGSASDEHRHYSRCHGQCSAASPQGAAKKHGGQRSLPPLLTYVS